MAEINALPSVMLQPRDNTSSTELTETEEDSVWIHWKDPYWKDFDSRTPLPTTTLSLWPARNGTRDDLFAANRDLTIRFVPFLVILALVLFLTILGNGLVIFIYRTRFRRNTDNFFVVFLAGMEIVFTCLGVPMEIVVLSLPFLFDFSVMCKVIRFVQMACVYMVLLTLTCIAVDRYWKLTHPTNYLSSVWARRLCICSVLLALCLALISPFVFGSRSVPTDIMGVKGVRCGVKEGASTSAVHLAYTALLLTTFVLCVVLMCALYAVMLTRISRRKSAARGERASPTRRRFPQTHRFGVTEESTSSYGEESRALPSSSSGTSFGTPAPSTPKSARMSPSLDPARVPLKSGRNSPNLDPARVPLKGGTNVKESTRIGQRGPGPTMDVQNTQMTRIFFRVTLWTVLAITPFMVFRTLQVVTQVLENVQSSLGTIMYQVGAHLYLLHPPVIPLIYLLYNHTFRRECRRLLQTLGLSCKRRTQARDNSSG